MDYITLTSWAIICVGDLDSLLVIVSTSFLESLSSFCNLSVDVLLVCSTNINALINKVILPMLSNSNYMYIHFKSFEPKLLIINVQSRVQARGKKYNHMSANTHYRLMMRFECDHLTLISDTISTMITTRGPAAVNL